MKMLSLTSVLLLALPLIPSAVSGDDTSKELISNGSMELGGTKPTGWRNWVNPSSNFYAELIRDTQKPYEGEASLRIHHESVGYSSTQADLSRVAPRIVVRAAVRHEAEAIEDMSIGIQCFDENRRQIGWLNLVGRRDIGKEWEVFERQFNTPEGTASWQFSAGFNGKGFLWIDDVSVVAVD